LEGKDHKKEDALELLETLLRIGTNNRAAVLLLGSEPFKLQWLFERTKLPIQSGILQESIIMVSPGACNRHLKLPTPNLVLKDTLLESGEIAYDFLNEL
jgi:hypothetical protein